MKTGTLPGADCSFDEKRANDSYKTLQELQNLSPKSSATSQKTQSLSQSFQPSSQKPLALYQESLPNDHVQCGLCPHCCNLKPGQTSRCLSRENRDGILYVRNYGKVTSLALDPIEKKPLASFHPGTTILSAGTFGCNLSCDFCQNWRISQEEAPWREISPEALLKLARKLQDEGNIGVAFTYNEPTIWYEYVKDCAILIHDADMLNVLVTNGFIMKEPLKALLPYIDAMNIDLKAITPNFYEKLCHGTLEPVLETIRQCHGKCHVELTTLIIPGQNDSVQDIVTLSEWIASISSDIPLHLTRHHPDYKMREPAPISVEHLRYLASIASRHLNAVHVGNV